MALSLITSLDPAGKPAQIRLAYFGCQIYKLKVCQHELLTRFIQPTTRVRIRAFKRAWIASFELDVGRVNDGEGLPD